MAYQSLFSWKTKTKIIINLPSIVFAHVVVTVKDSELKSKLSLSFNNKYSEKTIIKLSSANCAHKVVTVKGGKLKKNDKLYPKRDLRVRKVVFSFH